MSAATTTFVASVRIRDWRHFDIQLLVYLLLLIGFGMVMGYSAGFGDRTIDGGMSQTGKTLIWDGRFSMTCKAS